ncbi:putative ribonuclease H-like domain-containing protein, partial [Tanacetum coccineum]
FSHLIRDCDYHVKLAKQVELEKVSTDRPKVSTDGSKVSTDEQVEGTEEHNEGTEKIFEGTEEQREGTKEKVESTARQIKDTEDQTKEEIATKASQTSTQTPTSMIFGFRPPHRTLRIKDLLIVDVQAHDREHGLPCLTFQDFNGGHVAFGGIKREYSNARTPQQNEVAERKNKTLIEAARTMLADSFFT